MFGMLYGTAEAVPHKDATFVKWIPGVSSGNPKLVFRQAKWFRREIWFVGHGFTGYGKTQVHLSF
jgi:hypothetical protein